MPPNHSHTSQRSRAFHDYMWRAALPERRAILPVGALGIPVGHRRPTLQTIVKCPSGVTLVLCCMLALTVGCRKGPKADKRQGPGDAPVPVGVAVAEQRDVPVRLRAIGTVEPYQTVAVKSQVQGELIEVRFTEGRSVKAGEVLFVIDPRPFEVALRLAQATLAKNTAIAKDAQAEAARMAGLLGSEAAAQRESERAAAAADAAWAQVEADRANVDQAGLNLEYCTIRAPFDAYAGSLLAYKGAILKARETDLVTLNQVCPILVTFAVPEQLLAEIRANHAIAPLEIEALPFGDALTFERGLLTFIDNEVDRATGMIRLRGNFRNEGHRLWPGQFVNVVLLLRVSRGAVVLPTRAVQTGQSGRYVFVVKPDESVEMRSVAPGYESDGWTIIDEGLEAGETVVTDGHLRLEPGAKVQLKLDSATMPASQFATTGPAT